MLSKSYKNADEEDFMNLKISLKIEVDDVKNFIDTNFKVYIIQGGCPYEVFISDTLIGVFVEMNNWDDNKSWFEYSRPLLVIENYDKIWLSNSILIKKDYYYFIGACVFKFKTIDNEEIIRYDSHINEDDGIPYPFAIGQQYTYFMLSGQAFKNDDGLDSDEDSYPLNKAINWSTEDIHSIDTDF
jgi:hypothetical protein